MEVTNSSGTPEKSGRGKRAAIIIVVIIAALAACTLGAGAVASSSGTIYPNTYALGINLGGMTTAEAESALSAAQKTAYVSKMINVNCSNGRATALELGRADVRLKDAAKAAYERGRGGNFITNGFGYIASFVGKHSAGAQVQYDKAAVEQMLSEADEPAVSYGWEIDGDTLRVTKGRTGETADRDEFYEKFDKALSDYDFSGISVGTTTVEAGEPLTGQGLHNELYSEFKNAYYDKVAGEIVGGSDGLDFDAKAAQKAINDADAGETVDIPITVTKQTVTKEDLEENIFSDVLGKYTTNVGGSAARKNNVGIATEAVNGVILNSGETFSYNDTLGQRTTSKGYQAAPAYVQGETVDEIGGGICQVSSTLYCATLYSNLEIVLRSAHMFRAAYVPYGMDATVSWGGPDYQFKNNTDYPIKISASYSGGKLAVRIIGTKTDSSYVKMEYKILSTTPYKTVEQNDATLAYGVRQQKQNGYTGYVVETYRCIYNPDRTLQSRSYEAKSTYKMRNEIILVGTKGGNADVPASAGIPGETTGGETTGGETAGESAGETTGGETGETPGESAGENTEGTTGENTGGNTPGTEEDEDDDSYLNDPI